MKFKKEEHVVKSDQFDKQIWEDVLFDIGRLKVNQDKIYEKHAFVPDAFHDLFQSLFQGAPLNHEKNDMLEDHLFNHLIVNEFQTWNEVEQLRVSTKYDEYSAAFAMVNLQPEIEKLYEENAALMEIMSQLQELIKQLAETSDPGQAGEIMGQIQALKEAAEGAMDGVTIEFRSAVKQASDELAQEEGLMRTFGLEKGQLERMNYQERRTLADQLKSSRMLQFANLIGQFKMVAKGAKRSKIADVPDEIAGIEFGNDLTNLSTQSLSDLATPELELKFLNGLVNHELIQNRKVGPHALGKGPVIVVCDESGSMRDSAYGGTREQWSKALSLALCDQARRNRRDFIYIGFSSGQEDYEIQFPKGRIKHNELVGFIEHFFGGGTYPYNALQRAAELVDAYPAGYRPDIVFITDGDFGDPSNYYSYGKYDADYDFWHHWKDVKSRTGMQCFGISFDCGPQKMEELADSVMELQSMMASPDQMAEMFRKIDS